MVLPLHFLGDGTVEPSSVLLVSKPQTQQHQCHLDNLNNAVMFALLFQKVPQTHPLQLMLNCLFSLLLKTSNLRLSQYECGPRRHCWSEMREESTKFPFRTHCTYAMCSQHHPLDRWKSPGQAQYSFQRNVSNCCPYSQNIWGRGRDEHTGRQEESFPSQSHFSTPRCSSLLFIQRVAMHQGAESMIYNQ